METLLVTTSGVFRLISDNNIQPEVSYSLSETFLEATTQLQTALVGSFEQAKKNAFDEDLIRCLRNN